MGVVVGMEADVVGAPFGFDPNWHPAWSDAELTQSQFTRLGALIERHAGIRMPPGRKLMLERRLRRRLQALGMEDFEDYCALVLGGDPEELQRMMDEVTTNTTSFLREPKHFDYLTDVAVPELLAMREGGPQGELRVWSAACSTGEEPYTLAMVLAELAEKVRGLRWQVLASDLSEDVLRQASSATYEEERVEPLPLWMRKKYLLRKANGEPVVRIKRELRERVTFQRFNLLERGYTWVGTPDVIFCRNVFIYFDTAVQAEILDRFQRVLRPGGYLFLGHSETINGKTVALTQVAPTVYRKPTKR